jgi:hypothetical protein
MGIRVKIRIDSDRSITEGLAMSDTPIPNAGLLRRELSARNAGVRFAGSVRETLREITEAVVMDGEAGRDGQSLCRYLLPGASS